MKLDIEALDDQAQKITDEKCQTPGEYHPNWHDLYAKTFARLIVERCAVEAENTARIIDSPEESAGAIWAAEDIRSLLED